MSTRHSGMNTGQRLTGESSIAPSELESSTCPMLREGKLRLRELSSHTIKQKEETDPRCALHNTMLTASASGWIWTRSTSDSRCAEVGTGPVRSVDRTVRAARPPHMFTSICTHSYALTCTQLSPAHTQALCLLTLPELLPQWTHCAGDWCQGTQGLLRTKKE